MRPLNGRAFVGVAEVGKGIGGPTGLGWAPSMRILLVEDERSFARAVRRGLEAEGFVVELATDGAEGLRLANERSYDASGAGRAAAGAAAPRRS